MRYLVRRLIDEVPGPEVELAWEIIRETNDRDEAVAVARKEHDPRNLSVTVLDTVTGSMVRWL